MNDISRIVRLLADAQYIWRVQSLNVQNIVHSQLTVTFNIAIGNGDAHSKNYSLLIDPNGSVSLAPIYDTAPVMHLDPRYKGTGHIINGTLRLTVPRY